MLGSMSLPRLLACLVALGLVLAFVPAADAAKRRVPFGFYGVMWDGAGVHASDRQVEAQWGLMASSGVESVRVTFSWAAVQPTSDGPLDFSTTDGRVALASRHGIALAPVVLYTPAWASRDPGAFGSVPARPGDYAAFMRALVQRYGPDGSFWRENPSLPKRPIRDWQVWNEVHFDIYWDVPGDSSTRWAEEYVDLLRATKPALEAADPGSRLVVGGLADRSWDNLALLYRNGARGLFDVVALHIFTGSPQFVIQGAGLMREVMRQNGDARTPLWITETTFPAGKGQAPRPRLAWQRDWYSTARGAAKRLRQLYRLGARSRRTLKLERISWYTWSSSYSGSLLWNYSGLTRYRNAGFQKRPFLRAYRSSARGHEGCAKTRRGRCAR